MWKLHNVFKTMNAVLKLFSDHKAIKLEINN